jgi:hypothetical protein
MQIKQVFFFYLLDNITTTYCTIKSPLLDTYKHSLNTSWFVFKKQYSFTMTFIIAIVAFLKPSWFYKESNFGTKSLDHTLAINPCISFDAPSH